ncbi:MAG: hypothetical protein Q4D65_01810 [Peptostreptococcaceae bacterium]|nr:hypothetical protein [Peptostreptococcaceae bacterium]
MKKKCLLILLILSAILLIGCTPSEEPQKPDPQGDNQKPVTKMSDEDAKNLAKDLVAQAEKVYGIMYLGNFEVDETSEAFIPDEDDSDTYYLASIDGMKNIQDLDSYIHSVFSQEVASEYTSLIYTDKPIFIEARENLYYINKSVQNPMKPVWDTSTAKVDFESKDRLVMTMDVATEDKPDEKLPGKVAFERAGDSWKLDTDVMTSTGLPYSDLKMARGLDSLDKNAMIEFAGKKENGYRLDKSIDQYISEVDSEFYNILGEDGKRDMYFALNLYSVKDGDLVLEDKLFVHHKGERPMIVPAKDEKGILTLDFSANATDPNADVLAAYAHFGDLDDDDDLDNDDLHTAAVRFLKKKMITEDYRYKMLDDGEELYILIPKYYGSKVNLYELDTSGAENVIKHQLVAGEKSLIVKANRSDIRPDTKVVLEYGGESLEFSPSLSLKDGKPMPVEKTTMINYDPEKVE